MMIQPDFLIVGEWMSLKLFIQEHGKFVDRSLDYGFENRKVGIMRWIPATLMRMDLSILLSEIMDSILGLRHLKLNLYQCM